MSQALGELTTSRIVALPGGELAEAVITERREALARWRPAGGPWSPWRQLAKDARDVSLTADTTGWPSPAALAAVIAYTELPFGAIAPHHTFWKLGHFRMTATGIAPADL